MAKVGVGGIVLVCVPLQLSGGEKPGLTFFWRKEDVVAIRLSKYITTNKMVTANNVHKCAVVEDVDEAELNVGDSMQSHEA